LEFCYLDVMCGNEFFYFYDSLDLLNVEGPRHRLQVQCRIAINKKSSFRA